MFSEKFLLCALFPLRILAPGRYKHHANKLVLLAWMVDIDSRHALGVPIEHIPEGVEHV